MASFESDVLKLQKQWESTQGNKFSLDFTDLALDQYNNKLFELQPRINLINSVIDAGGKLQPVQLLLNQPPLGNQTQSTNVYGALIDVTINNIPEQWIPFVRFNIGTDSSQYIVAGQLTWFTEIEEISTNIVKATWHLGYFINLTTVPDFQFKIYLSFLSPTIVL